MADEQSLWLTKMADLLGVNTEGTTKAEAEEVESEDKVTNERTSGGSDFDFTLAKFVPGKGRYVYAQFPDGEIVIMQGPNGEKEVNVKRGSKGWHAITDEIGPYSGSTEVSSHSEDMSDTTKVAQPTELSDDEQEALQDFIDDLGGSKIDDSASVNPPPVPDCGPAHHDDGGHRIDPDSLPNYDTGLKEAIEESQRRQAEIQQQQIDLHAELLANPERAEEILAKLESANRAFRVEAGLPEPEPEKSEETLGEELLETHKELYQALLNARDPDYPNVLTHSQEAILEDMRAISEELAIEAERSVMAQSDPRLQGLDGEEFEDQYQMGVHDDSEDFTNEGSSDAEFETGETDEPEPSEYFSMFSEGEGDEEKTIDEIMADLGLQHDRMLHAQALGPEYVKERKQQIVELYEKYDTYGHVTKSIKEVTAKGKLIGFQFRVGEGIVYDDDVPHKDRGLPHVFLVDLHGKILKAKETNDMFTTIPSALIDAAAKGIAEKTGAPEIAVAVPLEVLIATVGAPVEAVMDAGELIDATAKWVQGDDGSIFPVLVMAALVVIPYSRAGKRVFRVRNELGKEVAVEASEMVSRLEKRPGTVRPEDVGFMTGSQMDEAAAIARADPGPSDAVKRRFEQLKESNRARYDEIREEYKRKHGEYPDFDRDPIPKDVADDVEQAFDDMVDDTPLPDDWYVKFDPDVQKVYKDKLPRVDFDWDNVHDEVYETLGRKLGIEGGAAAIKLKIKNLYRFISRDFPTEFRPLWDEAVKASKEARRKIAEDVPKYIDAIKSMKRKLKSLDPDSNDAKKLSKKIHDMTVERNEVARNAFDLVRNAFWRRANKRLAQHMKNAGLNVGEGTKAARIGGDVDQPISIEHGIGLEIDPLRAIDGSHMKFSPNYENTQILRMRRDLIKERFEELGYKGPHPWL